MRLRELGLRVQELETGPLTFLLVDSQPVAYADRSGEHPRFYRAQEYVSTERYQGKQITKALNKWLRSKPVELVPRQRIMETWQGVSRFNAEPVAERRREGRRAEDAVMDPKVAKMAQLLVEIMGNGASR